MTPKKRVTIAALLALALAGAMTGFILGRMQKVHAAGYAGFVYESSVRPNPLTKVKPAQVVLVYPGSPADQAGLRSGDVLVTIEGISVRDSVTLGELAKGVRRGDVVRYRIERGGVTRELSIRFGSPYSNIYLLVYGAVSALVAAAFIIIALVVLTRSDADRQASVFYAMSMGGALSVLGSALLALDNPTLRGIYVSPMRSIIPLVVLLGLVAIFTPLTLHLALVFPRERPVARKYPAIFRLIYGVPLAALVLAGFLISIAAAVTLEIGERSTELMIEGSIAAIAVGGMICLLRLARRWRAVGFLPAVFSMPLQSVAAVFGVLFGAFRIAMAFKWKIAAAALVIGALAMPVLVLSSYPLLACIALYRSYREAGVEERRQVKWPLWGTLIALAVQVAFSVTLPVISIYTVYSGGDLRPWMNISQVLQLIPLLTYLLIPVSFAAAILKYRLMNIDVIIKKTVVYAILSGTFFYATIDTSARRIRYCNAGHNPPVLVRGDGTTIRLSEGGPAFSRLFRTIPFQHGEVALQAGDRIVLFTDGVSEARDAAGNEFGEARLEEIVATSRSTSARELTAAISDEVSSFASGRADDDFTLVAVIFTSPA